MRKSIPAPKDHERLVKKAYPELDVVNIEILIDNENRKIRSAILSLISNNQKKYREKLYYILSEKYSNDHYKKVQGFKSITEIVFTKGRKSNYRIYCKEVKTAGKKVVMFLSLDKDFQKISENKPLENRLKEADKNYEY